MWLLLFIYIQVGVLQATHIMSHLGSTMSIQAPAHQRKRWLTTVFDGFEVVSHAVRAYAVRTPIGVTDG
jgi:hypothetical protein